MRALAVVAGSVVLAAAAAGAAPAPAGGPGLRGVVTRGPIMPVCVETRPCDAPAVGLILQFRRAGRVVAAATTGAGGAYAVRLPAGTYAVTTPTRRVVGTGLTPRVVRVRPGRIARVDFHLDTGIR